VQLQSFPGEQRYGQLLALRGGVGFQHWDPGLVVELLILARYQAVRLTFVIKTGEKLLLFMIS
jgi:hypothetical protein